MSRSLPQRCPGLALLRGSLLLAAVAMVARASPLILQHAPDGDPLMALPSDQHATQEVHYVTTYQQLVPAGAGAQEVVVEYQPRPEQPAAGGVHGYEQQQQQPAGAPYQLIQVAVQPPPPPPPPQPQPQPQQQLQQPQYQQQSPQQQYQQQPPPQQQQQQQQQEREQQPQQQHYQQQQQQQPQPQQQPQMYAPEETHTHVHSSGGPDCNQRHEYASMLSLQTPASTGTSNGAGAQAAPEARPEATRLQGEYPGEILYVGQGDAAPSGLQSVATSLSQTDMSATILTEIPVKDMPQEVLNKLKREYGVKVVATRERPGANLVINCEDYPGQEGSVCGRSASPSQLEYRPAAAQEPASYLSMPAGHMLELPIEHQEGPSHDYDGRQDHRIAFQVEHEMQPAGEPAEMYVTHEMHEMHEAQPGPGEQQAFAELAHYQAGQAVGPEAQAEPTAVVEGQQSGEGASYGTRTASEQQQQHQQQQQAGPEAHDDTQAAAAPPAAGPAQGPAPSAPSDEQSHQQEGPQQNAGEQYQPTSASSADSADQHAGFDDQPKSNER